MNKTEAEHALFLESQKQSGEILDYKFEGMKFRLADRTYYTPDFAVPTPEHLEMHEVKGGFWEDDARVKIKVAAEMYPWIVWKSFQKLPKKEGGGWKVEEF